MGVFLFDKIIFGPVKSRRLGISLGINLLPIESKLCNFNCIYCECGWTANSKDMIVSFHPRRVVAEKLEEKLIEMSKNRDPLDVITYAGNGEPTMHPEFEGIIDDTIKLRNSLFPKARIAVLSNATLVNREQVFGALNKIDDAILKLDSVFPKTIELINKPLGKFNIEKLVEKLKQFKSRIIIQTMFVKGSFEGRTVDNTTDTIARDTPAPDLEKVSMEELNVICKRLEKEGFNVQVSG